MPTAVVSLVADKCQWFKSAHGIDATETSREISFCGHAILGDETLVVENAACDPRFSDNPLVTSEPHIRFYAGHPLHTADGSRAGTLCVIDRHPRKFTPEQLDVLRDLASLVETEVQRGQLSATQCELIRERDELKRRTMIDGLTRLWNRAAIMELLSKELARVKRGTPMCVAMIDVNHFKIVNDTYGHQVGDAVLVELAARIRRGGGREYDVVGRYGGEEFIAVLNGCDLDTAKMICERIRSFVASEPIATSAGPITVTISIGLAACDAGHDLERIIGAADAALYCAKANNRNCIKVTDARAQHFAVEKSFMVETRTANWQNWVGKLR